MSYSCTSRGNSQDPSSAKKPVGDNPTRDSAGTDGGSNGSPKPTAAMKVKKGCNSTDLGVPVTTEEDLLASAVISPEDVLGLQKITESKCAARCWVCRVEMKGDKGARVTAPTVCESSVAS